MSKTFVALLALLALFVYTVDAHAWMTYPSPRGQYKNPPKMPSDEYAPANTLGIPSILTDPKFVCRNDPVMPEDDWITLKAGNDQNINIDFNAVHPGDCMVYLTYDGDKPDSQKLWFKIWQQHDCINHTSYNVNIPNYLPSGDHVVFRWEWYALHNIDYPEHYVEYYVQCVDAKLIGKTSGALPQPQFHIPGHLPALTGVWTQGNNNYWNIYNKELEYFVGPALASNGQPNPTTAARSTPQPTATPRPTQPTPQPSSTTRPTSAPPTRKPKPTKKPSTSTGPSTTSTGPATTTAGTTTSSSTPTTLVLGSGSSTWWIAIDGTWDDINKPTKVEVKDSNTENNTGFQAMKLSWGKTYTYSPLVALVPPLFVVATLPSGSTVPITVTADDLNKYIST